jgi:hypothetical protein
MLVLSAICWVIWKARNRSCFEQKKHIRNTGEFLYAACAFMQYWTGLYKEDTKKMINAGVDLMMKTMLKFLGKETALAKIVIQGARHQGGAELGGTGRCRQGWGANQRNEL